MDTLASLFRNLGNPLELEDLLSAFDQDLRRLVAYDGLAILEPESRAFQPVYVSGRSFDVIPSEQHSWQDAAAGGVILTTPIRLDETHEPTAILALFRLGETRFSPADLRLLSAVNSILAASIENARSFRRAGEIAEADPLTGLANIRSLFHRLDAEIARSHRGGHPLVVLQCSVEGFDRSGHLCSPSASRLVFEKLARRLREHCREYDILARSADDIVLVLPDFRSSFIEEKRTSLKRIVEECGIEAGLPLFAAVGAAAFPVDGADAEDLLTIASQRLLAERCAYSSYRK